MRRPRFPLLLNIILIAAGALAVGARAAEHAAQPIPNAGVETRTITRTSTRTIRRVVRGRIVHVEKRVYVQVPQLVVRTDHHIIRIPAHRLPLRSASATVANPLVTVYIPVQGDTVYVPTTVTSTETVEVPTTVTATVTATVSVPLDPTLEGGDAK